MKTLLIGFLVISILVYVSSATDAPAPYLDSFQRAFGLAAQKESGYQSNEGATSQKIQDDQDIRDKSFENYNRKRNENLYQTDDEFLKEKSLDDLNSARDLKTRDYENIDQGRNSLIYQRNKNLGNQQYDKVGFRDAGVDDSGNYEEFNNQNYKKKSTALSDQALSGFNSAEASNRNSQYQNVQAAPQTKKSKGYGDSFTLGQKYAEDWGGQSKNQFNNQNALEYYGDSDEGNLASGKKSNYNNKQWDKSYNKDSGKSNVDQDDLYFNSDQTYNKQQRENTQDLKDRLSHVKEGSKDAGRSKQNAQNMNEEENKNAGREASKQTSYSSLFDSYFNDQKRANKEGYVANNQESGKVVQKTAQH